MFSEGPSRDYYYSPPLIELSLEFFTSKNVLLLLRLYDFSNNLLNFCIFWLVSCSKTGFLILCLNLTLKLLSIGVLQIKHPLLMLYQRTMRILIAVFVSVSINIGVGGVPTATEIALGGCYAERLYYGFVAFLKNVLASSHDVFVTKVRRPLHLILVHFLGNIIVE
jgi:hypothetical protein